MSKTHKFSITLVHGSEAARAKLRALRDDFARMASDAAYKRALIEEARAREAEWDTIKAASHKLRVRQGRLFK